MIQPKILICLCLFTTLLGCTDQAVESLNSNQPVAAASSNVTLEPAEVEEIFKTTDYLGRGAIREALSRSTDIPLNQPIISTLEIDEALLPFVLYFQENTVSTSYTDGDNITVSHIYSLTNRNLDSWKDSDTVASIIQYSEEDSLVTKGQVTQPRFLQGRLLTYDFVNKSQTTYATIRLDLGNLDSGDFSEITPFESLPAAAQLTPAKLEEATIVVFSLQDK